MEAPPTAPPLSSAVSPTVPPQHLNYPDSVDSSPRSRNTDSWDEPYPPSAAAAATNKLRLMCSFGGHIVPRPHDKSLCYVGGETRIIVVERHTSLSDLSSRLSKTFLNGRSFVLKYLLPCEDLDSLISVTTDEDLDNMIEEYDRISNSSVKPSRIRFFMFPLKPDSAQSIPIINSSAKSEDWFLGMLNRGLSDSGSVNLLMGFDDEVVAGNLDAGSKDVDAATSGSFGNGKGVKQQGQDVHSVPDSPMMETSSSFGSTSSSPSVANLPPIRVHVDDGSSGGARVQDQKTMGVEDQFAQMGVSGAQKQDEGFALSSPPTVPASAVSAVPISPLVVSGEYQNRVVSDDERSDHGVPVGYRKPPTQQPQILQTQFQQKTTGGLDLPSPDSVSSDNSFASAMSRPKPVVYQDQVQVQIPSGTTSPSNPVDPKFNMSDSHGRIQMHQQVLDQGYVLQQQFNQQHHQQQQQFDQQHQQQQQFDQQQQQHHQQQFDQQQQQHHQQQFDQQQQQHHQQQFDQQQQQHHQQQFDQQQQQHHQQQFDQQQQQRHQQHQFDQQQQQHQFDQQQQQRHHQQQFDQQQQQHHQQQQFIHGTQQHVHESGYVLQSQFDQQPQQQQQQFIHGTHFVHHTPSAAVPMQSYFPVYPSQQQQQLHPQLHHQLEPQQYQYYILPARQTQAYHLSSQVQQPSINEPATTIPSSRAQATPSPAIVQQSSAYNPVRNAAVPKSEMNAGAYRTAVAGTAQLVQVHSGQPQQQFVAYSQYHHPSQSVASGSAAPASYAYEYTDPAHSQIYYSQPLPPTMPSQYQTMAGGAAAGLPDASAQPPSDSMKQQTRTS